ncbi:MAG: hypothetical protein HC851_00755 [Acaryochloris sp. RU_4_1]|nr:hypothetical protein [Acaryochloris sp. RU_4_1]NJR53159.1 hypothetical protein [Acaryochloris sp. CRU_2_0]
MSIENWYEFEVFDDRLEITSAGSIPAGVERDKFFAGYSTPRNKILMRVFRDLDIVEYLGSGMPRILKAYPKESFIFTTNFIRTVFPISREVLELERESVSELLKVIELEKQRLVKEKSNFRNHYQNLVQRKCIILYLTDGRGRDLKILLILVVALL